MHDDAHDDAMAPALTPDEWATWQDWAAGDGAPFVPFAHQPGLVRQGVRRHVDGLVVVATDEGVEPAADLGPDDQHRLAALCLHDQPFGFAWQDVADERDAATDARVQAQQSLHAGEPARRAWFLARAARHDRRAARIAALLPPEGM